MHSEFISGVVTTEFDSGVRLIEASPVSGGCISHAVKLETNKGNYFLKYKANEPELFEAEKFGLEYLAAKSPIKIPSVISSGAINGTHYLLMAYVESGRRQNNFWIDFGAKLARQHRMSQEKFGFDHDNFIGRSPQKNSLQESWVDFFIQCRIMPQLALAQSNGLAESGVLQAFDRLSSHLPHIFPNEAPALLHGDLWSGNFMVGSDGHACVFDPAVYFGHREAELAFTTMFGGFDSKFYDGYETEWPLEPGFDERIPIYNLYPELVHLNLFGPGYLPGIKRTLSKF